MCESGGDSRSAQLRINRGCIPSKRAPLKTSVQVNTEHGIGTTKSKI